MDGFIEAEGYKIAPDFSFTVTEKAVHELGSRLYHEPIPVTTPDWVAESQIFAWLTLAEGYTYENAQSLIGNPHYNKVVHDLWASYKEWQAHRG
jgi:hypothetical protein